MNDFKFALRQLLKSPGFTAIAALVLALGIGANTAIFSLVNAFLFKPIVARQPERLAGIYSHDVERERSWRAFSAPNYRDLRARNDVFEDVLALVPSQAGLTEGETTRRVFSLTVSANYFDVLGVAPFLGRSFQPVEDTSATAVVMVSHRWWRRHGSNPAILGQTLRVNGHPHTVVGVTAPGFSGTTPMFSPDLYFPLGTVLLDQNQGVDPLQMRDRHSYLLVGRLKDGVDLETANTRLEVISRQLATAYPEVNKNQRLSVNRLPRMALSTNPVNDRAMLGRLGTLLAALAAAVLFIACLNLANMLLARGTARRREIAVRLAIGASRYRIVRQLLIEGVLLALLGGSLGLLITSSLMNALSRSIEQITAFPIYVATATEWPVLFTTLATCGIATLLFALGPAIRLVRTDVNHDLKVNPGEEGPSSGRGLFFVRNTLVVGQVALSLALLVAGGLFGRSALNAMHFDPGFPLDRGVYAELDGGMIGYSEEQTRQRYAEVLARIRPLPGVESASLAATIPLGEMSLGEGVQLAGAPFPAPPEARTPADGLALGATLNVVGADYFRTLGLPLARGREFTAAEAGTTTRSQVAVINTVLARALWPTEEPGEAVGRQLQIGAGGGGPGGAGIVLDGERQPAATTLEVIGIVPPQRNGLFEDEPQPMLYLPYGQRYFSAMLLHVRARPGTDLTALLREVRAAIHAVDPNLPILKAHSLQSHMVANIQTWVMRTGAVLFGSLGGVALLLAMLGVYGVKAYAVARRTREIGIRMALGSTSHQIMRLLLGDGLKLTALGLVLGSALAGGVALAMDRMLYEVGRFDPAIMISAPLLLAVASLLASWLPTRRALRADPMRALRAE